MDDTEEKLRQEYWRTDAFQLLYNQSFLLQLMTKTKTSSADILKYCRRFSVVACYLLDQHHIDNYTACIWFLTGLPSDLKPKVMRIAGVAPHKRKTMDFDRIYKVIYEIQTNIENAARVSVFEQIMMKKDEESVQELIDNLIYLSMISRCDH